MVSLCIVWNHKNNKPKKKKKHKKRICKAIAKQNGQDNYSQDDESKLTVLPFTQTHEASIVDEYESETKSSYEPQNKPKDDKYVHISTTKLSQPFSNVSLGVNGVCSLNKHAPEFIPHSSKSHLQTILEEAGSESV